MCSFFCSWRRRKQRRQKVTCFASVRIHLFAMWYMSFQHNWNRFIYSHRFVHTQHNRHARKQTRTHHHHNTHKFINQKVRISICKMRSFSARKKNLVRKSHRALSAEKSIHSQITMTHHTHKWNRRNNINKVFESMNHGNYNKLLSV